ncbi:MAG: hypothetical protein AAFY31_06545, partial [Pseudomonadota bacterium]
FLRIRDKFDSSTNLSPSMKNCFSLKRCFGVKLLLFAGLIATDQVNVIAQWMLDTFPVFSAIG